MPDFHVTFRDLLHAVNLRHGTNGFTSLPKEGVLRIFSPWKNPTASAEFKPSNFGTKGQHATSGPPKLLSYHRNRLYNHRLILYTRHPLKGLQKAIQKITLDEPFVFISGNSKPPSHPFKESVDMSFILVKFSFLGSILAFFVCTVYCIYIYICSTHG